MNLELFLLTLVLALGQYGNGLFGGKFNEQQVIYLQANKTYVQEPLNMFQSLYKENGLQIYCRRDQPLSLTNVFQTNRLKLISQLPNMKYSQYMAATATGVHEAHLKGLEFYEGKVLSGTTQRVHYITMPSHTQFCYGIYTDQAYNLSFVQERCDFNRLGLFAIGLVVWLATLFYSVGGSMQIPVGVVAVLGMHLASWLLVCIVLFLRGDYRLRGLQPLGTSFKVVLGQYTTSSVLGLVAGVFMLVKGCQRYNSLCRSQLLRSLHCRLLRLYAYILILSASNNTNFGWTCVCTMFPWPELWWLLQWLKMKWIKSKRYMWPPLTRRLLTEPEFAAQADYETERALNDLRQNLHAMPPNWEQMSHLQQPQQFAQYMSRGIHDPNQPAAPGDGPFNTPGVHRGKRNADSSMF